MQRKYSCMIGTEYDVRLNASCKPTKEMLFQLALFLMKDAKIEEKYSNATVEKPATCEVRFSVKNPGQIQILTTARNLLVYLSQHHKSEVLHQIKDDAEKMLADALAFEARARIVQPLKKQNSNSHFFSCYKEEKEAENHIYTRDLVHASSAFKVLNKQAYIKLKESAEKFIAEQQRMSSSP